VRRRIKLNGLERRRREGSSSSPRGKGLLGVLVDGVKIVRRTTAREKKEEQARSKMSSHRSVTESRGQTTSSSKIDVGEAGGG